MARVIRKKVKVLRRTKVQRTSNKFNKIINFVRAKYILAGKKPPTVEKITEVIADRINQEELLQDVFIKL